MQTQTRWTKWLAIAALAATAGACADQTPTAFESPSSSDAAAVPAVHASVSATTVASVLVFPNTATIKKDEYRQYSAFGMNASNTFITTPPPVTWTSSNPAVATVNYRGVVKGVGSGTATITATMGGIRGRATVTVLAPASVAWVKLTPGSQSAVVGNWARFTAIPMDAAGHPLSDYTVSWTSSNAAVAKVFPNGSVQALKVGTATITAKAGGKVARGTITVTASAPSAPATSQTVLVFPSTATISIGGYRQASAFVMDAAGKLVTNPGTPTWRSSNPAVATVSSTGVIKGISSGTVTVTATINGASGRTTIYVTAPLR